MRLKPQRSEVITGLVTSLLVGVINLPLWRLVLTATAPVDAGDWLFFASLVCAAFTVTYLALLAISHRSMFRPIVSVLLPVSAATSFMLAEYGTLIDAGMLRNFLQTDPGEASDLISASAVISVLAFGIVPAIALWFVPWSQRPFFAEAWQKAKLAGVLVVGLAIAVYPFWGQYLSLFREHHELKLAAAPYNSIMAVVKYAKGTSERLPVVAAPFATDAKRADEPEAHPHVFVVVVGETARADKFGLNGYGRDTTPELSKVQGLINFPQTTACGTDTTTSVPCMFSGLHAADFTNGKAAARENLLDVLTHAKIDIDWLDNQAGCKGVCQRVPSEQLNRVAQGKLADAGDSFDDVLADALQLKLKTITRDTVIVLHMMGSHGPAYWKRYPSAFEVFTPVCKDSQFSHCTSQEITNAYDNTIRYTDHVLARITRILNDAGQRNLDTGMLYVSDHGESLGEGGLYLHGMPRALAPEAQTHVPMVVWLSDGLLADNAMTTDCLARSATAPVSHDNLFHSVLGIMDVTTTTYDRSLDIFAACTTHAWANDPVSRSRAVKPPLLKPLI